MNDIQVIDNTISTDLISQVKFGFPVNSKKNIDFASFTFGDYLIKKFSTSITLQFPAPMETKYGKTILVKFNDSHVRQHLEILINRVSVMQNIDPKTIKNPISDENKAYLKVGPKYVFPTDLEVQNAVVSFGVYHNKETNSFGLFLRLE